MPYANSGIYYEVSGGGQPIVFIHGFTLDHTMWRPQVACFSKKYQVISYDARGFGKSSLPDESYSHVTDLRALLEHLGIEQAHLVGLSLGGRVAINFALKYPGVVKTLTLMSAALDGCKSEIDWNVYAKEQGLERAKKNWLNHELFATARSQPEVANHLRAIIAGYSGWHWLNHDQQHPAETNARDHLQQITMPTLIVLGEYDLTYFHTVAHILATEIPGAQKAIVAKAGHMVNMEAPDTTNEILAGFIGQP